MSPSDRVVTGLPFYIALSTGLWADASQLEVQPKCAGPSCTWEAFQSVGWCSKCVDAKSYTSLTDCDVSTGSEAAYDASLGYDDFHWKGCSLSMGHGRPSAKLVDMHMGLEANEWSAASAIVWSLNELANPLTPMTPSNSSTFLGIKNPLLAFAYAQVDVDYSDDRNGDDYAN